MSTWTPGTPPRTGRKSSPPPSSCGWPITSGAPRPAPLTLTADDAALRARLGATEAGPELTVEGPVRALTGWLSGRADGDGLQVHRDGGQLADARAALPQLPAMG